MSSVFSFFIMRKKKKKKRVFFFLFVSLSLMQRDCVCLNDEYVAWQQNKHTNDSSLITYIRFKRCIGGYLNIYIQTYDNRF